MRSATVALACASALALAGCSGGDDKTTGPKLLDERRGTYQGVGIGSSSADIRARFGRPSESQGFIPLEPHGVKGPYAFGIPGSARPSVMRYDRVAFILAYDRVFGFITSADEAVLTRKVGVGDSLDDVRNAYPFACREARAGEGIFGPDPTYTLCHAELANGSQLVVTKDPVESITLLRVSSVKPPAHLIDERRGTVDGVAIGDAVATVQRRIGTRDPADPNHEPVSPLGASVDDYTGPTSFKLDGPFFRYRGITFFVDDGRVAGFMATGKEYSTATGVHIGDDLASASAAYRFPSLRCGTARRGDTGRYPACTHEIAWQRYLWLGGDPVSNITVMRRPLHGV